jgi:DNA-binding CsgD family transcriptional regulator
LSEKFDSTWDVGLRILDRYQNPLFIIDQDRTLVFRNNAAARVMGAKTGLSEKGGKLRLGPKTDAALQRIMAGAYRSGNSAHSSCYGLRLTLSNGSRDWLLLVQPLEQSPRDKSAARTFLLQAVGRTRPRIVPSQALQDLFGLTERETAVVTELLRSGGVQTAASQLSLSRETIRSHLKRTFRKCNVHSKSELLSLLQCVSEFVC